MAPEVYNNQPYDSRSDIYSLGMVLYRLLNENRGPFLPMPPETYSAEDEAEAREKRMHGQELPPPMHGSPVLKQIVQRACRYFPEDRYQSSEEMLRDLQLCRDGAVELPKAKTVRHKAVAEDPVQSAQKQRKRKRILGGVLTVFAILILTVVVMGSIKENMRKEAEAAEAARIAAEEAAEQQRQLEEKEKKRQEEQEKLRMEQEKQAALEKYAADRLARIQKLSRVDTLGVGGEHIVGLKADGTVVAVGNNQEGQCNVSEWKDIQSIAVGKDYTLGLREDGTVVSTGENSMGQCNVSDWTDIISISTSDSHTVGLKSDGTVVAVGNNSLGQCEVSDWKDIVSVGTCMLHTIGVKSDGTLVSAGLLMDIGTRELDIQDWTDIQAISTGFLGIAGIRSDGTLITSDGFGDAMDDWEDIVALRMGTDFVVGLKMDGTLVGCGSNGDENLEFGDWTDIQGFDADFAHTIGVKSDGTILMTRPEGTPMRIMADGKVELLDMNAYGQQDAENWSNIRKP